MLPEVTCTPWCRVFLPYDNYKICAHSTSWKVVHEEAVLLFNCLIHSMLCPMLQRLNWFSLFWKQSRQHSCSYLVCWKNSVLVLGKCLQISLLAVSSH